MRYIVVLDGNAYGSFDTVQEAEAWTRRNGLNARATICTIVKVR